METTSRPGTHGPGVKETGEFAINAATPPQVLGILAVSVHRLSGFAAMAGGSNFCTSNRGMGASNSVGFFDRQFRQQVEQRDFQLNPFELAVLPFLQGRVLDYGCGLGNLALAAVGRGCVVTALDASPTAIASLRERAAGLPLEAIEADLRNHTLGGQYDAVVSIGLLMFFDCVTARRVLVHLQELVCPGGIAAINVLVEGTTWFDAMQNDAYCLFGRDELERCFAGWHLLHAERRDFPAPGETTKAFVTVIARKPA